jgi:hypothetical protein
VYARDGFRCTNPVCGRRDLTPHHPYSAQREATIRMRTLRACVSGAT